MGLRTALTEMFDIEHPVVPAPMGDVAGGALAGAVSDGGGLGVIDAGANVVVAQGSSEAGGHGGGRATLPFVPAVVDIAGSVPVLAAGGIADGRGLAAALVLGAAGDAGR